MMSSPVLIRTRRAACSTTTIGSRLDDQETSAVCFSSERTPATLTASWLFTSRPRHSPCLWGDVARGVNAIREAYTQLLAGRPTFIAGKQRPPLIVGELALTSTRLLNGSATAEVARRQPDGTWLWAADQPDVLG